MPCNQFKTVTYINYHTSLSNAVSDDFCTQIDHPIYKPFYRTVNSNNVFPKYGLTIRMITATTIQKPSNNAGFRALYTFTFLNTIQGFFGNTV